MAYQAATLYFPVGGPHNTAETLRAAMERAEARRCAHLLVASTTGFTALAAVEALRAAQSALQLVIVGEHWGYHQPGEHPMPAEVQEWIRAAGAQLYIGTMALSAVGRSFRQRWGGIESAEIVAESLRRLSRGVKTGVEAAIMAADAGLVPIDRDLVAVGGSGRGADTAILVRPTNMNRFFDLKVRELIALPVLRDGEAARAVVTGCGTGRAHAEVAAELQVPEQVVADMWADYLAVKSLAEQGLDAVAIAGRIRRGIDTARTYLDLLAAPEGREEVGQH